MCKPRELCPDAPPEIEKLVENFSGEALDFILGLSSMQLQAFFLLRETGLIAISNRHFRVTGRLESLAKDNADLTKALRTTVSPG